MQNFHDFRSLLEEAPTVQLLCVSTDVLRELLIVAIIEWAGEMLPTGSEGSRKMSDCIPAF